MQTWINFFVTNEDNYRAVRIPCRPCFRMLLASVHNDFPSVRLAFLEASVVYNCVCNLRLRLCSGTYVHTSA